MTLTRTHSAVTCPQVEMKDPLEAAQGTCPHARLKMEDLLQAGLRNAQSLEARALYLEPCATPHARAENRDASN